jgi:hypothetical protein
LKPGGFELWVTTGLNLHEAPASSPSRNDTTAAESQMIPPTSHVCSSVL